MVDTLETAEACGLALLPSRRDEPTLPPGQKAREAQTFDEMLARWFPLTYVLNSLNRSLGMPDNYPFSLSPAVVEKLRFVHAVVQRQAASSTRVGSKNM